MQATAERTVPAKAGIPTPWFWWGASAGFVSQIAAHNWVFASFYMNASAFGLVVSGGVVGCLCLAVGVYRGLFNRIGALSPSLEPCFPLRGRWLKIALSIIGAFLAVGVLESLTVLWPALTASPPMIYGPF